MAPSRLSRPLVRFSIAKINTGSGPRDCGLPSAGGYFADARRRVAASGGSVYKEGMAYRFVVSFTEQDMPSSDFIFVD